MSLPPLSMWLRVDSPEHRTIRLWLPLFIVWLLLLPFLILALALAVLVDLALLIAGQKYHYYTAFLLGCGKVLGGTRGMVVHFHSKDSTVDMSFQ